MKTPYDNVDKRIAKLKEDNRKLLNNLRLRLSTFDEANIISAKKQINVIFEKMKQNALSVYLKSVKEIYPDIDKKMLLDWLDTVYIVLHCCDIIYSKDISFLLHLYQLQVVFFFYASVFHTRGRIYQSFYSYYYSDYEQTIYCIRRLQGQKYKKGGIKTF